MDLGLRGKTALVQAATSGLGRAVAVELSREGCTVSICGRDEVRSCAVAAEIEKETGLPVLGVGADVRFPDQVERHVARTIERFGGLQIAVCNAGGPPRKSFEETSREEWDDAVRTNFLSAVETCRIVLPHLRRAGWGRILLVTSLAVKQPVDGLILSNAARAGATGFAKTLATEVANEGITVNCLCPGVTRTPRLESLIQKEMAKGFTEEEAVQGIFSGIPAGRIGTPAEFAAVAAFLCSTRASYVTGASIAIDGGSYRGLL